MMQSEIFVRPVREEDLSVIVAMEERTWPSMGADPLSRKTLTAWYLEKSPFFLIAECSGTPCGFYFGRMITLTEETALTFLDQTLMSSGGIHQYPYAKHGNSVYGITMLSTVKGAGRALYTAVWKRKKALCIKYSIGISRLSDFRNFAMMLNAAKVSLDDIALWYATSSARQLGLRMWPSCKAVQEWLPTHTLQKPDRMLAFHTYGTSFGLLGVLPGFMTDPESMNYGAVILSEHPHF